MLSPSATVLVGSLTLMKQIKDLKKTQVLELAEAHIDRYCSMIGSGHPAVRVSECHNYIFTWTNIKNKVKFYEDWLTQLTPSEKREVIDAIYSGDYEDIVGSTDSIR